MRLTAGVAAQVSWARHFLNLLWRAWLYLLSELGTTTLAVIIFSLLVPILVLAVAVLRKRSRVGWRTALADSLKPTAMSVGIALSAWAILYAWAVGATVYNDHRSLVAENDRLRDEVRGLRAALKSKDDERRTEANPAALRIAVKDRLGMLQRKADTVPPNDEEKAKAWGKETRDFIRAAFGDGEATLFLSDAGFVFYGGDEDTRVRNWMIGRLRRLSSIIERADSLTIRSDFKP